MGAAVALTLAPPLGAQAICSAPHSSPTLAQSGSIETLPPGAGWAQVSGFRQHTSRFFNPSGERQPLLARSEFDTRSLFVTGAVGLAEGVEAWAQVPVHRLSIDGAGGSSTSSGAGDLRAAVRLGSAVVGRAWPVALRLGVKVPGSDFPVDATVLPLTEGQTDVEVSLESGAALGERPVYVMGWAGYRWRSENEEVERVPGDEVFGHLAVGGAAGRLLWEVGLDGLMGGAPVAQGVELTGERRRLLQVVPTLGWGVGPGRLEATLQVPLAGRNLPAGTGVSVGYRVVWGLDPP